jgi:hypothetical protein
VSVPAQLSGGQSSEKVVPSGHVHALLTQIRSKIEASSAKHVERQTSRNMGWVQSDGAPPDVEPPVVEPPVVEPPIDEPPVVEPPEPADMPP